MRDMVNDLQRLLLMALTGVGLAVSVHAEPVRWVFEGLITQAAPELAPDLQSGWVLSGSFLFDPLELEEAIPMNEVRSGRLEGGISEGELTADLYYRIHFEASQVSGYAGFDYQKNDPDQDGRDLIGWFLPMAGQLKESGWRSTWLQVWLSDPEGRMLPTAPPAVPPGGFQWEAAWFRLSFINDNGQEAAAEGRMEIFSPESAVERRDPESELSAIISDLGNRLVERDATIAELRADLASQRDRLSGLRSMVDLLVDERAALRSEVGRLEEQVQLVDPTVQEELAEKTAEKALLEQQIAEMNEANVALEARLGKSEARRRELMDRIADLENAIGGSVETASPSPVNAEGTITAPDGSEVGKISVFQAPMVIEKEVPVTNSEPLSGYQAPPPKPDPPSTRRFGPRKFR